MSLKKQVFIFAGIAIFGLGLGSVIHYLSHEAFSRSPASVLPAPAIGKPQRTMDLVITAVNGIPNSDTQELTLRADVTLHQALSGDIEYNWVLPQDATVVAGELNDVWQNLQVGQTASVTISLLNVSREEPKTVVFQAFGTKDGVKIGASSAFTTALKAQNGDESSASSEKIHTQDVNETPNNKLENLQQ